MDNNVNKLQLNSINNKKEKIRKPRQVRGINTKNQIMCAAEKLFKEKGFRYTNTKEIAAEAGVSVGCFYSYFIDKYQVLLEIIRSGFEMANTKKVESIVDKSECYIEKKGYINNVIRNVLEKRYILNGFNNHVLVASYLDPITLKAMEVYLDLHKKNLINFIAYWKKDIKVEDLETATILINNVIHSTVDMIVLSKSPINEEKLISETVDMIIRYLFN